MNKSRENELVRSTRESEQRQYQMRPTYYMTAPNPLDVPPEVMRDGYQYLWVPKDVRGDISYEIDVKYREGWELVPVDRCPNYTSDVLKRQPYASQYFCYRDVMLMERPLIYKQKDDANFYKMVNQRVMLPNVAIKDDYMNGSYNNHQNYNRINSF